MHSHIYILLSILSRPDCLSDSGQSAITGHDLQHSDSHIFEEEKTSSFPACLADEEMKLEEEKIDELTKKEEYERIKAQLKAKRVEEERKIAEEKR